MDFLRYAASAAQAALATGSGIPNLPNFGLGDKINEFEGSTIWSLYEGTKRDDNSAVSIFVFDANAPSSSRNDRRSLLPLAKNALRKLRALRHPDILKYVDGSETENAIYIVTEKVVPLTSRIGREGDIKPSSASAQETGTGEEWRVWGLSKVVNALGFVNDSGTSVHGNLRVTSVFVTPSGEWRLGGFEVLSSVKDSSPIIYTHAGLLPESAKYAPPEIRKSGYEVLKSLEPHTFDSYLLLLFLHILFNGPVTPSLSSTGEPPNTRGSIPLPIYPHARKLFSNNPNSRLKPSAFYEIGNGDGGFFRTNRLVVLAEGLANFALAGEGERAGLIKSIKESGEGKNKLPAEFLKWKVLPELVKAFEFGPGGPQLLPLILSLGESGGLSSEEYDKHVAQPVVRMFASPDRAMRMALLDGLPLFIGKLDNKVVTEKLWPQLLTGFADTVPVIREATVKSVLMLAPKLTDRILNNDLLRHLAKTQTDAEPGIRTNTCILLGRLSKHLSANTNSKVLIPAFSRALRDPFVHARMAGLMALMATIEVFGRDDLAGRIIPCMAHALVDKEKIVRDQAFKAIDMFVKRAEKLVVDMPATQQPPTPNNNSNSVPSQAGKNAADTAPGLATNTAGAAGALAGWAFNSFAKKLAASDLQTGIGESGTTNNGLPRRESEPVQVSAVPMPSPLRANSIAPILTREDSDAGDWGGDLMDVNADADDWDSFETGAAPEPTLSTSVKPKKPSAKSTLANAPPLSTKKVMPSIANTTNGALKLGSSGRTRDNPLLKELEAEANEGDDGWDLDGDEVETAPPTRPASTSSGHWNDPPPTHFAGAPKPKTSTTKPKAVRPVQAAEEDSWGLFDDAAAKEEASWDDGQSSWKPTAAPSKPDSKSKMDQMREERKARVAALKTQRTPVSTPPPPLSMNKSTASAGRKY